MIELDREEREVEGGEGGREGGVIDIVSFPFSFHSSNSVGDLMRV
jgi:hypothetical protein